MPITIADLLADDATLTAWCSTCESAQDFRPDLGLRRFPPGLLVVEMQRRMRCRKCGGFGEAWIRFPSQELLAQRVSMVFTFHNRPFRRR